VAQVGSAPGLAIPIEVTTWVTRHVAVDGSGSSSSPSPSPRGRRCGRSFGAGPRVSPSSTRRSGVPTTPKLGEHIEVVINDAVLGVTHELDSPLKPGDRITLLGQFMGG